jgi:hypothetical protein
MYILDDGLSREDCEEKRVFEQKRDGRIGTETVLTHLCGYAISQICVIRKVRIH